MRYVLFKKWIAPVYPPSEKQLVFADRLEGTGVYSDFIHKGTFHQWVAACIEGTEGFGNHTVALVELNDGTMESVDPNHIKFI